MHTLAISLSDEMMLFLEAQATAKGLATASEYVQHLILLAQQDAEQTELEARFRTAVHALERGEPCAMSGEDWKRLQSRTLGKHAPQVTSPRTTST